MNAPLPPDQTSSRGASIDVQMLRSFAVSVGGVAMPAHAWRLRHPRQLFQMLCLRSGHRMHRDEVVECLWPGSDAKASANRLYHTVHVLRSEFAKAGLDECEPVLRFEAGTLWLNPHHRMNVDAQRLDALVAECRRVGAETEAAGALLEGAAELFETPELGALANVAGIEPRRGEIRDHCVWVLERLAAHHGDRGRHEAAIRVLQRLVAHEPSNEVAHRALMQLFDASNQPERALLQYTACRRFVQRDLAAEPSEQTQALRIAIAERSAAALMQRGAGRPAAPAQHETPTSQRAPLLGRSAELDELSDWLRDRCCRLVTIAAPAGTGKTSVALALADLLHDRYRDGVLVVKLTALSDPAALEQSICRAAGLAAGVAEPGQLLRRHFDDKQLLLVLDRFEHLVEAALQVSALIDSAPGLQVIVTSQCNLNCQAERVFDLCQLGQASMPAAIELFVRTARDAGAAEHQLADRERIAQLCAGLGGNALAIQLAAAQPGLRSIDAPPSECAPRAALLEGAEPEPQHHDLRAAITWSLSLLRDETRAVLHGLTVFAAGFTIEDAQAVLQDVFGIAPTREALKALLEQHLVCRDPAPVGACGPDRFVLLDSIRQALLERVEDRVAWAAVEASHAQRFGARTREAFELLRAGRVPAALALFEPHERDALGALDWRWARGDLAAYLQACLETCTLQMQRGGIVEVGPRLRHAVEQPAHGPEQLRHSAWCCYLLSRQLDYVADTAGSLRMLRASRQRSVGVDDDLLLDRIGTQLATIRVSQLRLRAADMHMTHVIRLSERAGAPQRLSKALLVHGGILGMGGHYAAALNAAQAGFDTALQADDPQLAWWAHVLMADLALRSGQLARARGHRDECMLMERLGFFRGVPLLSLKILYASLHFELEEHDAAQACLGRARDECGATDSPHTLAIDICAEFVKMETGRSAEVVILLSVDDSLFPPCAEFGEIYMQLQCYRVRLQSGRGESANARRSLASALMPIRRSHNQLWASWLAGALAGVAADHGQPELAQSLLDQAATLQREAHICASPRQLTSWRQVRELAASVPRPVRPLPWRLAEGASIALVVAALEAIARVLLAAPRVTEKPVPHPPQPTPRAVIDVQMLRPFAVSVDDVMMPAHAWRLRHPRQLFQMLCLRAGQRMHRDEVVECLWPGSDAKASANRLYHTVHVLRSEFAKAGLDEREPVLRFEAGTLWLNDHHGFDIDVLRFETLVAQCQQSADGPQTDLQLEAAAALCDVSPPGAAHPDIWFDPQRAELREKCVWLLERLVARHRARGRDAEAITLLQRLIGLEPSNELAHRALMELFEATGQPDRAMLQYLACKRFVQRDLDAQPSLATAAVRDAIAARASQSAGSPGTGQPDPYRAPPTLTTLLGRAPEMAELGAMLADERHRLITIAAPAGTGKTSLAMALAQACQESYRNGVLVVNLAALSGASELASCLCRAAGVPPSVAGFEQALQVHFANMQLLLVLDRFEHVVDAAALLTRLIEVAPGVVIVVTSQCVLNSQAETVFALRQLADASPAAALELFVTTASNAGARPAQLVDTERVMALCMHLGGNALAIRLAAAQLASHPIERLLAETRSVLDLTQERAADEPQLRSLRSAIGWSASLLEASCRDVLQALAVFQDTFSLDDAQAVLGQVFDAAATRKDLMTLIERHLVSRCAPPPGPHAEPRLALPDSVRQLMLDRADSFDRWQALRASHSALFRARTAEARDLLFKGRSAEAVAMFVAAERDIEWALENQRIRGPKAAWLHWRHDASALQLTRGSLREATDCLERAVRAPARSKGERLHSAWCCYLLSRARDWAADAAGAVRALRLARQRSRGCDDDHLHGLISSQFSTLRVSQLHLRAARLHIERLGRIDQRTPGTGRFNLPLICYPVQMLCGQWAEALMSAEAGLDAALESNSAYVMWWAQHALLEVSLRLGRLDRARAHADECRAFEHLGFDNSAVRFNQQLLHFSLHLELQEYAAAVRCLSVARDLASAAHSPRAIAADLGAEFVLMETGRHAEVEVMLGADEHAFPFDIGFCELYVQLHCYRLRLLAQRGDWGQAQESLARALRPIRRSRNALWLAWLLDALAMVAAMRSEHAMAHRFLGHAQRLHREAGLAPSPRQRASWARVRAIIDTSPPIHDAAEFTDGAAQPMPALIDALDAWAREAFVAPKASLDWSIQRNERALSAQRPV